MSSGSGRSGARLQKFATVSKSASPRRSSQIALLLIAMAATAVVAPMFFLGNASGHDFSFHLASWLDVAGQWREGVFFPRWAQWANWGFGEPRFIFYPPASWTLGAALGSVLPWKMVPGTYTWLVLLLSGFAMWRLARESLPDSQAIAAALIYVLNPYQLVVVYYRSDYAELLASALFPLLVFGALRVVGSSSRQNGSPRNDSRQNWAAVPLLAFVFAAIWLSNAPAAVIATYSLVLLLIVASLERRNFRPLIPGAAATLLGLGLAAFYILPAAFEQRWVQISQVTAGNYHLDRNFLYTRAMDPEFALFNWKVSTVALGVMLLTGVAGTFSARKRREYQTLWWMLAMLAVASTFMMFPASLSFWRHLPKLQFLQFPWRWLIPLGIPYAFFLASAIGQSRWRWIGSAALALVIALAATAIIRDAWWDSVDIPLLAAALRTSHGYEGVEEYAPLACDIYDLPGPIVDPESPKVFEKTPPTPLVQPFTAASLRNTPLSPVQISIDKWHSGHKSLRVATAVPVTLALRLLNYPAWEVRIDGAAVNPGSQPKIARMLVPVPAGQHRIEVNFRRTWDRTTGAAISGFSAILLLACGAFIRRRVNFRNRK
ncbi:MAG: 6-pyruvoyl-tetrahydropterin synthase-related protein [Candidatus Acidiferrales bacterium]